MWDWICRRVFIRFHWFWIHIFIILLFIAFGEQCKRCNSYMWIFEYLHWGSFKFKFNILWTISLAYLFGSHLYNIGYCNWTPIFVACLHGKKCVIFNNKFDFNDIINRNDCIYANICMYQFWTHFWSVWFR